MVTDVFKKGNAILKGFPCFSVDSVPFLNRVPFLNTSVTLSLSSSTFAYINIKLIYHDKFKTTKLVIRNISSLSIGVLPKTNVIYKFKCHLGDCISDNNNIYVGLTSNTLSRRLTIHLSDTSSIAQHLKKHSCPTTQLW